MRNALVMATTLAVCSAAQDAPRFEAASVKPSKFFGTTLKVLVAQAYDVPAYEIAGPAWIGEERYEIVTRAAPGTTAGQKRAMMRNLLAERFELVAHRETREMTVYVLVRAKGSPKLRVSPAGEAAANGNPGGINLEFAGPGRARIRAVRQTLGRFTEYLGSQLQRRVIDETGLAESCDFQVDFTPAEDQIPRGPQGEPMPLRRLPPGEEGPSLFAALEEQLGLKLDSRKAPVEFVVVDRARRVPTEN